MSWCRPRLRTRPPTTRPSADLDAFDDEGVAYDIWPCTDCLPWHAEVVMDDDGEVLVREWHAVGCEQFRSLLSNNPT
ncbi:MAG: hypothetical protein NVS3B1_16160 [Marmoricola sp.]